MKPTSTLFIVSALAIGIFLPILIYAQVPQLINYQALLTYPQTNLPIADGEYTITFSIYSVTTGGTSLWTETQIIQTTNGIYSVLLGSLNPIDASLFASIERYLGVTINADAEMKPRKQIVSIPYAIHAKSADTVISKILETQTLADVATINNAVNAQIKNVNDPTDMQDAATKAYSDALIYKLYEEGAIRLKDIDGNYYNTIKIGVQIWMAENLRTTKFNDGESIPRVTDGAEWVNLSTPGYCWYDNDSTTYAFTYGALYNWYTINTGKLCPKGWHVPNDIEWITLTDYLGGSDIAGGKLKEAGTIHWISPNTGATNESGFKALPGGDRWNNAIFGAMGYQGFWWSSTEYSSTNARYRTIFHIYTNALRGSTYKEYGLSVRCLRN
jgi:uncharacterized protein (TIGR02145 family)